MASVKLRGRGKVLAEMSETITASTLCGKIDPDKVAGLLHETQQAKSRYVSTRRVPLHAADSEELFNQKKKTVVAANEMQ